MSGWKAAVAGHLARWIVIGAMGTFLFFATYGLDPWSPESAVEPQLHAMDLPSDVTAVSAIEAGELHSIVFLDERHDLYHVAWMKRVAGTLWQPQGGGFGMPLEADMYRIRFGEGFSSRPGGSYHVVYGQVNDARVAAVEVRWRDGTSERMTPAAGRVIHFARAGRAGDSTQQSAGLAAYDADGALLYELDHENSYELASP